MTPSPKTIRVVVALFISFSFIAAGYYFSSPLRTSIANATSTEEILKAAAVKDTDSDGLPDWQESLYGTNPENAHSVDQSLTDGEAVQQGKVEPKFKSETPRPEAVTSDQIPGDVPASGSLTDRFAKEFFSKFVLSKNVGTVSDADKEAFVADAVASIVAETATKTVFSEKDVVAGAETGPEALQAYGFATEAAQRKPQATLTKDELSYMLDYMTTSDEDTLKKVALIGKAYHDTAYALIQVSVPPELRASHLKLANTFEQISIAVLNMAAVKTDPVLSLVGIGQYSVAAVELKNVLDEMHSVYDAAGVRYGKPYDRVEVKTQMP